MFRPSTYVQTCTRAVLDLLAQVSRAARSAVDTHLVSRRDMTLAAYTHGLATIGHARVRSVCCRGLRSSCPRAASSAWHCRSSLCEEASARRQSLCPWQRTRRCKSCGSSLATLTPRSRHSCLRACSRPCRQRVQGAQRWARALGARHVYRAARAGCDRLQRATCASSRRWGLALD